MKIFGLKIIKAKKYDDITSRVAECGRIYRKYSGDEYSTQGRKVSIPCGSAAVRVL